MTGIKETNRASRRSVCFDVKAVVFYQTVIQSCKPIACSIMDIRFNNNGDYDFRGFRVQQPHTCPMENKDQKLEKEKMIRSGQIHILSVK
jgi:hypothetical protein